MKKLIFILFLSMLFASNESFSQISISGTIPYEGSVGSGTYKIFRSSFNDNITLDQIQKPIILVEGFDPNAYYDIDDLYNFLDPGFNSVADQLHTAGHDILILDFADGGDLIQRNAYLLVELIQQLNAQKPNDEPVVVVGFSMGGLVARYALTYMEENDLDHETELYISFDSPHKGANVPLGIQALGTTFDAPALLELFPDLQASLAQFSAPAAKQMLKYRIDAPTIPDGEIPINPDHLNFLSDMENQNDCNGFPTKCRNVAISLGSWNGIGQRSTLDKDNNGVYDLQHSGMPMVYINFPEVEEGDDVEFFWELNSCEMIATIGFQAFLSTSFSDNYPHFNERGAYLNDFVYATYWYSNQFGLPLLPTGSWSRFWSQPNMEPIDFAPGGNVTAYEQLLDGLNSQIECSFALAEKSTFVPTVSAFAFDTQDMFHNILGDADRLEKTPFDEIIGVTGENRRHDNNVTGNASIVNFIVNEIAAATSGAGAVTTCAKQQEQVSGTVNSGEVILIEEAMVIEASDYTIESGATVDFNGGEEVVLLSGFIAELGSSFDADIVPCSPKTCAWEAINTNRMALETFDTDIEITCTGKAVAMAKVNSGNLPYTFAWSNGIKLSLSGNQHAQSNLGNGSHSVTITDGIGNVSVENFTIDCLEIEEELESKLALTCYPNPAIDQTLLVFNTNQDGYTSIDLYNMDGILLKHLLDRSYREKGTHQIDVPLSTYARGVYIIKVQHNDHIEMKRILLK